MPRADPVTRAFAFTEAPPRPTKPLRRIVLFPATELSDGQRRTVNIDSMTIGIFNIAGRFYAIKDVCPHQGAPLCKGTIESTHAPSDVHTFCPAMNNRVLRCPWHGWEFDIHTGQALHDPHIRVATYPIEIDSSGILVLLI
jgi:nitrite reductase (NADH) small subunit